MMFFTLILMFLLSLILISIVNTLIFLSLKLITGENFKESCLILPSFLSLIIGLISYTVLVKVVSYITGMSIFDSISALIFNTSDLSGYIYKLFFFVALILIVTLFLQSFALLTVNIDYTKTFNKSRYFAKRKVKSIKNKIVNSDESDLICNNTVTTLGYAPEKYELSFINSFVCNLFIFSLLFFLIIIFFWVGTIIGNKII